MAWSAHWTLAAFLPPRPLRGGTNAFFSSPKTGRTEYTGWAADTRVKGRPFMEHWTRRISTAAVRGNARRALNALASLAFRLS